MKLLHSPFSENHRQPTLHQVRGRTHLSKAPDNGVGHRLLQHNDGTRLRILRRLLFLLVL